MKDYPYVEKRIKKKYHLQDDNIHYQRFFQDLFSGYSYVLGDKNDKEEFYTIEPEHCELRRVLNVNDASGLSYGLEKTISSALCHLAKSGKAYLYLEPKYIEKKDVSENNEEKKISELKLGEIVGYPRKKLFGKTVFYALRFGGGVIKKEIEPHQLIVLDLRDFFYRRNTFYNMVSNLSKIDNMESVKFVTERVPGYDYSIHVQKKRMRTLKLTKDLGWYFGAQELSESYILYKKMQQEKLQIRFLSYAIKQINDGIKAFLNTNDAGEIVFHLRELDYDHLWDDYSKGRKTLTELRSILY